MQIGGRLLWPPPLQTGINAKILKISLQWWQLSFDKILIYLLAEFELYPSNIFWENRCWNHKYSFFNVISEIFSILASIPVWRVRGHIGRPPICKPCLPFFPSILVLVTSQNKCCKKILWKPQKGQKKKKKKKKTTVNKLMFYLNFFIFFFMKD